MRIARVLTLASCGAAMLSARAGAQDTVKCWSACTGRATPRLSGAQPSRSITPSRPEPPIPPASFGFLTCSMVGTSSRWSRVATRRISTTSTAARAFSSLSSSSSSRFRRRTPRRRRDKRRPSGSSGSMLREPRGSAISSRARNSTLPPDVRLPISSRWMRARSSCRVRTESPNPPDLDKIFAEEVTGIELDPRPATVPAELRDAASCGALVLWIRDRAR